MKRKDLIGRARELRQEMTEAEKVFWKHARHHRVTGHKFRRQHPVGSFVLDFYLAEKRLGIEIDGGIHQRWDVKENDKSRATVLEEMGIKVIRFTNEEVMNDIVAVFRKIVLIADSLPHP